MPKDTHNPTLHCQGVHLFEQQAQPLSPCYRTKVPSQGWSHHPTQASNQILSWWCQPSPTGRGDGETESRNTQIAKKRLEVSLQVFLRSHRKRKTVGKTPALALDCEQRWLAAQHRLMMRCVPAGIARPARRDARSPPAQQAPFPASSHPLLQCVPVSPPSLYSRRPHHVLIIQPRGRPGSPASLPSLPIAFPTAGGWGRSSCPQPPGRGEAAPLPPRAPHAGAGPLPTEQLAQRPGPRGRGVRGGREEEEETWCNADSDGLRRRGCVFWGGLGRTGGRSSCSAVPSPGRPPAPCAVQLVPEPSEILARKPAPRPAAHPARRWGRGPGETRPALSAGEGRRGGAGGREAGAPTRQARGKGKEAAEEEGPQLRGDPAQGGRGYGEEEPAATNSFTPRRPGREGPRHPRSSPGTARLHQPDRPQPHSERTAHQSPHQPGHPCHARPVERASPPTMARRRRARRRLHELRDHERRRRLLPPPGAAHRVLGLWACAARYIRGAVSLRRSGALFPPPRRGMCEVTAAGGPAPSAARPLPRRGHSRSRSQAPPEGRGPLAAGAGSSLLSVGAGAARGELLATRALPAPRRSPGWNPRSEGISAKLVLF